VDPDLRDRWLELATQRIARSGLRAGAARTRVVEFLAREGQCLIDAQALAHGLRTTTTPVSQASVYRALDELLALGLLTRVTDEAGVSQYEIADPEGHHHHHIVDEDTGRVESFEDAALEAAIAAVAERLGVELVSHEVILRGTRAGGPPARQ